MILVEIDEFWVYGIYNIDKVLNSIVLVVIEVVDKSEVEGVNMSGLRGVVKGGIREFGNLLFFRMWLYW